MNRGRSSENIFIDSAESKYRACVYLQTLNCCLSFRDSKCLMLYPCVVCLREFKIERAEDMRSSIRNRMVKYITVWVSGRIAFVTKLRYVLFAIENYKITGDTSHRSRRSDLEAAYNWITKLSLQTKYVNETSSLGEKSPLMKAATPLREPFSECLLTKYFKQITFSALKVWVI